jgi:hypothetical protein
MSLAPVTPHQRTCGCHDMVTNILWGPSEHLYT